MAIAVDISRDIIGARERSALERVAAVEKVIAMMYERLDQPLALDEMAGTAYLSRFYFNRVFREITGLPPVRFHTALRIAEAKRLLVSTDLSVTEVCLEVGYQSLGTFITHFHELVGVSPRELRRAAASPWSAGPEPFGVAHAESGPPAVEGNVIGVDDDQSVFIGLFKRPHPQGRPLACTVVRGSSPYTLRSGARAAAYAAATVIKPNMPPLVALSRRPVRLAPGQVSRRDLRLRPMRLTDPPILLALPAETGPHGQAFDPRIARAAAASSLAG